MPPDPSSSSVTEDSPQEQVTILVHGTFANPEGEQNEQKWWRLSKHGEVETEADKTGADKLHAALRAVNPDFARTMWRPGEDARDGDLTYRDLCEWSGDNTHEARIQAAKELAASLHLLASRRGCTAKSPLLVNFVAHSHGGNVVLASLEHLGDRVQARQICLLGTPLTWRFGDLRILYYPIVLLFQLIMLVALFGGGFTFRETPFLPQWMSLVPGMTTFLGWIWGVLGWMWSALDWMWLPLSASALLWVGVLVISLMRGISELRIFPGTPAYGPPPSVLEQELRGRPAVLFLSPEDEADLMLQLGAAPIDAYRALVRGRPTLADVPRWFPNALYKFVARSVELLYLRPFSYVFVVPAVEMWLEYKALGQPAWDVLFNNYEMVSWTKAGYDEERQIRTVRPGNDELNGDQKPAVARREVKVALAAPERIPPPPATRKLGTEDDPERIEALRSTLNTVLKGVADQVQAYLRHSQYYQSPAVIAAIAESIAGDERRRPHP